MGHSLLTIPASLLARLQLNSDSDWTIRGEVTIIRTGCALRVQLLSESQLEVLEERLLVLLVSLFDIIIQRGPTFPVLVL